MTRGTAERFHEAVRDLIPCCVNCEHFSQSVERILPGGKTMHDKEFCVLDKLQRPIPAKIAAFGCQRFSHDIPF